jgi:hypothetical protein
VGTEEYFGVGMEPLRVTGSEPVHLLAAYVPDVPDGLRILGAYGVSLSETAHGDQGGVMTNISVQYLREHDPAFRVHPLGDVVIRPGPGYSDWYLVIDTVPTRVGSFAITQLRVLYESGGSLHTATFGGWRLVLNCSRANA